MRICLTIDDATYVAIKDNAKLMKCTFACELRETLKSGLSDRTQIATKVHDCEQYIAKQKNKEE